MTLPASGDAPFPTIVMLHGFGGNKANYEASKPAGDDPASATTYLWNSNWFARRPRGCRRSPAGIRAFASLAAPVQVVVGGWAARHIARTQPVKLWAAIEGLQRTQTGAPFSFGGFYDADRGEVRFGLEVPKLQSADCRARAGSIGRAAVLRGAASAR